MKEEFRNRIVAQRTIVKYINDKKAMKFKLAGLSKAAIERWIADNSINHKNLEKSLIEIAEKLFLLANKSQEQISRDYEVIRSEVEGKFSNLKEIL